MKHLGTKQEFDHAVSEGNVVVDFYANWCGPCRALAPFLDNLQESNKNVSFYKVNVEENEECSERYNITGLPTLLFFQDGKLVNTVIGAKKDAIADAVGSF